MGHRHPTPNPLLSRLYKAAVGGDMHAARWLVKNTPNGDQFGDLIISLCRDKADLSVFRRVLRENWLPLHAWTPRFDVRAPESRALLRELLTYAAFEPPASVPERLTLWRGTAGVSVEVAKSGYFWTTQRVIAIGYAISNSTDGNGPLLLRAEVHRSQVAKFQQIDQFGDVDGHDGEAFLLDPPDPVHIEDISEGSDLLDAAEGTVQ